MKRSILSLKLTLPSFVCTAELCDSSVGADSVDEEVFQDYSYRIFGTDPTEFQNPCASRISQDHKGRGWRAAGWVEGLSRGEGWSNGGMGGTVLGNPHVQTQNACSTEASTAIKSVLCAALRATCRANKHLEYVDCQCLTFFGQPPKVS